MKLIVIYVVILFSQSKKNNIILKNHQKYLEVIDEQFNVNGLYVNLNRLNTQSK